MKVKATREGLVGQKTASGFIIDKVVPFVALPSTDALHRFLKITNPLNGKTTFAIVLDVGPWNTHDNQYVFAGQRPQVESSPVDTSGRLDNNAAIDLGEKVWNLLGMKDNGDVEWEFI